MVLCNLEKTPIVVILYYNNLGGIYCYDNLSL